MVMIVTGSNVRARSSLEHLIGPRPKLTLVIEDNFVAEIWVEGRAPIITIQDYDWGQTDPDPVIDAEGFAFSPINWRGPAWTLGLSLHPPAKETYTMANQTMKSIPLSDLKVSKLNMRHERKAPDVSDILPSVREHGVRQSLLVRQEGNGYGVIAGRRRLFALKQVAKETGIDPQVPCILMTDDSDAEAMQASLIENVARVPATEMEQYTAFKKLHDLGRSVDDIANYYGVTDLTVKRVLALANLITPIRKAFSDGDIDRQTVRALTLATKVQQKEWFALFEGDTRAPMGRACRAWVTGGHAITTDKALFDLDGYQGRVVADLFGEQGVFADAQEFWQAQSVALSAKADAYTDAGWSDVQVLERGTYFQSWDYKKCPRTKGGHVFIEVRHNGDTVFHEGYISEAEARRRERTGADGEACNDIKSEMSGPMATYVMRHRHAAACADLLGAPAIALRLMVSHALTGSSLWDVRKTPTNVKKEATTASLEAAPAAQKLEAESKAVGDLFEALDMPEPQRGFDGANLSETFSAFLAMSDEEVMRVLTHTMAATLEPGGAVVEALLHVLGTDLTAHWKPDNGFFELLRDKRVINAMLSEVASPSVAEAMLTDTGKAQKEAISQRIDAEGAQANANWRPGWMQVPPTRVLDDAQSAPVDAWEQVRALFVSEDVGAEPVENTKQSPEAA